MTHQTFRWVYPFFPKRTVLLEAAIALVEELDLVQQLGEQIELQRSGPYLSDYLEGQLANLTKLKNILAELKKCKENSLQAES